MNTKLNSIKNWSELAHESKWSVDKMAKICHVSVRTLHRHFIKHMGKSTKSWLMEQRHHNAKKILCDGYSIKETASRLGYKQPNNFTRHYRIWTGLCPSQQSPASPI